MKNILCSVEVQVEEDISVVVSRNLRAASARGMYEHYGGICSTMNVNKGYFFAWKFGPKYT